MRYLVLDEADRMLDDGFEKDLGRIVNFCPKRRCPEAPLWIERRWRP